MTDTYPAYTPTIDCQSCGAILQTLTEAQAQMVTDNPENFIGYCHKCKTAGLHIEPGF